MDAKSSGKASGVSCISSIVLGSRKFMSHSLEGDDDAVERWVVAATAATEKGGNAEGTSSNGSRSKVLCSHSSSVFCGWCCSCLPDGTAAILDDR